MHAWESPAVPRLPETGPEVRLHTTDAHALTPVMPAGDTATLYVCGITPYDATHLGHANTYIAFDLLGRAWRNAGLEVRYAQNVTDVDDPLLERATATGVDWRALAEEQTELFREDMRALRVIAPDHYTGVVEAMDLIADTVRTLWHDHDAAYALTDAEGDDLYFPVDADPGFFATAPYDEATMLDLFAQRGGDPERPGKRHPLDALLWRHERPGDPAWDTALGVRGRPGWHIECSAIAVHHLGMGITVQGGGSDLIFPHHHMSASHAKVAHDGAPFAHHFAHAGMVGYQGEKMSKSKGNLVFVSRLRAQGVDPMTIRLALLSHHYRSDWEWYDSELALAGERLSAYRSAVAAGAGAPSGAVVTAVLEALADDLDAPRALSVLDQWAQATNAGHTDDPAAGERIRVIVDAALGVAL